MEAIAGAAYGVNASGLAVSLAFGGRKARGAGFGVPLIVRYLLEVCERTRDAVAVLRRLPSHMSYNLTLIDPPHGTGYASNRSRSPAGPWRPTIKGVSSGQSRRGSLARSSASKRSSGCWPSPA